jgi:hypothetical protein
MITRRKGASTHSVCACTVHGEGRPFDVVLELWRDGHVFAEVVRHERPTRGALGLYRETRHLISNTCDDKSDKSGSHHLIQYVVVRYVECLEHCCAHHRRLGFEISARTP